jgi:hypothetical protein
MLARRDRREVVPISVLVPPVMMLLCTLCMQEELLQVSFSRETILRNLIRKPLGVDRVHPRIVEPDSAMTVDTIALL